jgi:hypothetical protein
MIGCYGSPAAGNEEEFVGCGSEALPMRFRLEKHPATELS